MGIFADKDIPVGEEITYDYQFQHHGLAAAANAYRYPLPYTPAAWKTTPFELFQHLEHLSII